MGKCYGIRTNSPNSRHEEAETDHYVVYHGYGHCKKCCKALPYSDNARFRVASELIRKQKKEIDLLKDRLEKLEMLLENMEKNK